MQVRVVRMAVAQLLVAMPMGVRLSRWIFRSMLMLMMLVMHVWVTVRHWFMDVLMLMTLGRM